MAECSAKVKADHRRTDKEQSFQDKVTAVNDILAQDSKLGS